MTAALSRRAALAGAVASIAMIGAAGVVAAAPFASESSAWKAAIANRDQVYATWQQKQDAFGRAEDAFFADRNDATDAEYQRADAENDHHCGLDSDARRALNDTPAPDLSAAIYKLEQADEWGLPLAPAIADLRRLAGVEVAA